MLSNELLILSILTLAMIGILGIILVYLMIRKAMDIKISKRIDHCKEKYNPLISLILTEGGLSRELTAKTALQRKAIEELLSRYTKVLEREEEKKRLSKLAALYLTDDYQKRLKSMRWSTRMNTLYQIEDFGMDHLLNDVYMLLKRRRLSHQELIHILRILALFHFGPLFELLTNHYNHLSEYEYRNILLRLEQRQFDQFVLNFHKSELPLQKAIVDVISIKKELSYLSFLENIFSNYSGEVKLRALKALAVIGYVKNIEPYLELLYSSKWEERMISAKLIGKLKEEKGVPRLIELLHDQSWWVRFQAGQSICQFLNGKEILRLVLESSKDSFAKDMAWEWLHKGE
ncbi:HEAT repeat domain-containing protein [Neobacillus soli]|uniref:HEAT repeat domain-containing protein n=1 Tax=Neobacillus soli TaxID=220688 RepID=UPI000825E3A9|nr:HEAT repeat domain-containing protein [Neobacillus soli]